MFLLNCGRSLWFTIVALAVGYSAHFETLPYSIPQTCSTSADVRQGRPTDIFRSGKLAADLDLPNLNAKSDRIMICGSIGLNQDMKVIAETSGLGAMIPCTFTMVRPTM
jgi:hypothetical protein